MRAKKTFPWISPLDGRGEQLVCAWLCVCVRARARACVCVLKTKIIGYNVYVFYLSVIFQCETHFVCILLYLRVYIPAAQNDHGHTYIRVRTRNMHYFQWDFSRRRVIVTTTLHSERLTHRSKRVYAVSRKCYSGCKKKSKEPQDRYKYIISEFPFLRNGNIDALMFLLRYFVDTYIIYRESCRTYRRKTRKRLLI